MTDHTPDALASALPAGITYPADDSPAGKAFTARWDTREIARFQAEKLAESGYVLIHPEYVDEATVERLARAMVGEGMFFALDNADRWGIRQQVRIVLAALAGTSAQARHTADSTGGGEDG